jgi:hypothetical protein
MRCFTNFLLLLNNAQWIIDFKGDTATLAKGKVSRKFILESHEILARASVRDARISGVYRAGYVGLEFSRTIPQSLHQPLRNLWGQYSS